VNFKTAEHVDVETSAHFAEINISNY